MNDILSWDKAVDKKVKSSDEQDLGMIESITREYNQAKQGLIGKKYILFLNIIFKATMMNPFRLESKRLESHSKIK